MSKRPGTCGAFFRYCSAAPVVGVRCLVTISIQSALASQARILTELALRSKAHWGYGSEFIDACRDELTITSAKIRESGYHCFVASVGYQIVGFAALERNSETVWELNALFVEPGEIGKGIGSALMEHAMTLALHMGGIELVIQSDPHAESFYIAAGAERTGNKESVSIPGRMLPMFCVRLGVEVGDT